jgi:acyl transferase domain-containing protein/phosphopantetheinyl transferase
LSNSDASAVAIVGMACLFPGAPDLETYWDNLKNGVDAITSVPAARIDPVFFDKHAKKSIDRFYCRRGGFVDDLASFDAVGFGVMPVAARGAEPDQLLALEVAARALADAGYADRAFPRERTAVILGRGGYAGPGRTRLEQYVRSAEQLVSALRAVMPDLSDEVVSRVKAELQANIGAAGADAVIGLVPNLAASRIAQRLDLHGPAFTVDAACASAVIAVDHGVRELVSGRCDLVLSGGVHFCHDETFWSVFTQLGALSKNEMSRPFDRRADGLLIGEGCGIIALKRLADAERAGDRIYAVLRGVGSASDGRGATLMSPAVEGQVLALARAWTASGLDPARVGLVEAHGTATPTGDEAELTTLARFFGAASGPAGDAPRAVLGSVKSMIGHTMPAAGAAGLIKAALAIFHGTLLPSLHCEEPSEKLAATRFRVLGKSEPWEGRDLPRVAAVSAFGFGGINAHAVLEQHGAGSAARAPRVRAASSERAAFFSAPTHAALVTAMADGDARHERRDGGPARAVVFDPTPERVRRAREIVEKGRDWRGRDGVWFSSEPLVSSGGKVAFVFPGVDSSFEPRVEDVAKHFGLRVPEHAAFGALGAAAEGAPFDLERIGMGIVETNRLLDTVLRHKLGIKPFAMAGHSIGEWSGMIASGMLTDSTIDAFIAGLRPGSLEVPGVVFAAAGCGVDAARTAMEGLDDIALSHDNCPHQVLLCGKETAIDIALARLRTASVLCQKLPFRSGFHSHLFSDYLEPHRAHFATLPLESARVPLYSATTCEPYPDLPGDVRALALSHLVRPVRFRELTLALYDAGVRVFLQIGTGSLVNFVEDTLRGRRHLAIAANVKDRSGLEQLRRLSAAMFVEGADVDLSLFSSRAPMRLELGVPIVRKFTAVQSAPQPRARATDAQSSLSPTSALSAAAAKHPLAAELQATMDDIARAQRDVLELLASPPSASPTKSGPRETVVMRRISLESMPELIDHTFFRQPPGWSVLSDRHPVVPMTALIDMMLEHAAQMVPGTVAITAHDVRAYRWMVVSTPLDLAITCRYDGNDRVEVRLGDYAAGTVQLADEYPAAPRAMPLALENPVPSDVDAVRMYSDRYMFHGPAYRCIVAVGDLGDDGIRGTLEAKPARGALLDNAGQLFGFWVMVRSEKNRMAMPVRVGRLELFGPMPKPGDRLDCDVKIRSSTENAVVADMALTADDRVAIRISDWEDRRFETDERLWAVMRFPEENLLSVPQEGGFVLYEDKYRAAPTREQLARRFLSEQERVDYARETPRAQRAWLAGRIAAKDAVRDLLWKKNGKVSVFPIEATIKNASSGKPEVTCARHPNVTISIAHKEDLAVAIASDERAVGIDIEKIVAREETFAKEAFSDAELKLVAGEPPHEAWTRLWTAKEAASKARGTGLVGAPRRRWPVTDRAGDRFLVDGIWVKTVTYRDFIIAWTEP